MMKKKNRMLSNILSKDWIGSWGGKEFEIKDGESKLFPDFMADTFAEKMAMEILFSMKQDIIGKAELTAIKNKMLGDEIISVEVPSKTEVELLAEEIEYVNKKYLNK